MYVCIGVRAAISFQLVGSVSHRSYLRYLFPFFSLLIFKGVRGGRKVEREREKERESRMGDNLDGSREDKSSHGLDRLGLRDNGHRVCRGKVERAAGADRTLKLPRVDLTILATFSLPSNIFSFFSYNSCMPPSFTSTFGVETLPWQKLHHYVIGR